MKEEGGFVFERPVICVCCRQEHSNSLFVLYVCVMCMSAGCVCFSAVSKSSAYRVLVYSVCFSAQICHVLCAGPLVRLLWSRMAGWLAGSVASCSVVVANLLSPDWDFITHIIASRKTRAVWCRVPRHN